MTTTHDTRTLLLTAPGGLRFLDHRGETVPW